MARGLDRNHFLIGLLLIAAGCYQAPLPELGQLPDQPADFPVRQYQRLAASGQRLYAIETQDSWVHIKVFRSGRLERLGHNHIVSTSAVRGLVAIGSSGARADLYVRLADLALDLPELRTRAGDEFQSRPSAGDVESTRANMLGSRVLDALRFPFVRLSLESKDGIDNTTIRVRGVAVPLEIESPFPLPSGAGFEVNGSFNLRQSDFGIDPFSVLGGMLKVRDELLVEYHLQFLELSTKSPLLSGSSNTEP